MKKTTIKCPSGRTITKIEPSDGFKNVTDGVAICHVAYVGQNGNVTNWHDTNDEPPEPEEDATAADYEAALSRLGVGV